jgi:hypothetical protein
MGRWMRTDFDAFWDDYPRKIGRLAAEKSYVKARIRASASDILAGLARSKRHWTDPKYIPYPATWLNQGRWMDEYEPQRPTSAPWTCPHLEICSHRAMCESKNIIGPEKYPMRQAS